jgi:hypothetical protein
MAKVGRNEACPCGSGKKSKRCCEANKAMTGSSQLLLFIAAGVIAAAILVGLMSTRSDEKPTGTWSAEHGHYHAP